MEDTLWALKIQVTPMQAASLNPYSIGRYSMSPEKVQSPAARCKS